MSEKVEEASWNPARCKHCGRTVWERALGIPGRETEGSGMFIHHHNWDALCFPNQIAEVDERNPYQSWPVSEPEPTIPKGGTHE
jgi:hypothetical protein